MIYDVIIGGGGPAGATAGYLLAKQGIKCILFDRAKFPREKPCGGALTARIISQFPYVKEFTESENFNGVLHSPKDIPEETISNVSETPSVYFVRRKIFDNQLFQLAKNTGCEVKEGTKIEKVTITQEKVTISASDGQNYEGKFLLGADGASSSIREAVGLQKYWNKKKVAIIFTNEIEFDTKTVDNIAGEKHASHIHLCYGGSFGYGWVFAKLKHFNVGFGEVFNGKNAVAIKKRYDIYVHDMQVKGLLPKIEKMPLAQASPCPMAGPMKIFALDRILLLGDAAGFVQPLSGEGILYAMWSAQIACETIGSFLQNKISLEAVSQIYSRTCWKEFADDLHAMAGMHGIAMRGMGIFFQLAKFDKKLCQLQGSLINCDTPFKTVRKLMLWRVFVGILKGNLWRKTKN